MAGRRRGACCDRRAVLPAPDLETRPATQGWEALFPVSGAFQSSELRIF